MDDGFVFSAKKTFVEWYTSLNIPEVIEHINQITDTDELIEYTRQCCLSDPIFLLTYLYGYEFKWFHEQWVDEAIKAFIEGSPIHMVLGPRGSAKSTVVISGCVLWILIHEEAKQHTMGVISTSKDKATFFMSYIKDALESEKITCLFGDLRGSTWKSDQIDLKGKGDNVRGSNLRAFGRGGGLVGQHFTLGLFLDDLVDGDMITEHYREKLVTWWDSSAVHTIEPGAVVLIAGTRWHPKDWYQTMIDRGCSINKQRSCWVDKDLKIPLWPEKGFTREYLEKKEKENPVTFQMQMENEISLYEGEIFKRDYIKEVGSQQYTGEVVISCDIAFREKRRSDYSVVAAIRKTADCMYVIENVIKGHWSPHEFRDHIIAQYKRYAARKVLIEDNFNNVTLGNRLHLIQDLRKKGLITMVIKPQADKVARYWQVQPLFESGQVLFRAGLQSAISELIAVPNADHDDQADAITQGLIELESKSHVYSFG